MNLKLDLYYDNANSYAKFQVNISNDCRGWLVGLVGCGLTSHSAIFQLYSDGTVVQFPNFDLLPDTKRHWQLGVFSVPSLPRQGHRDVRKTSLTSLPSEGPHAVRVCRESNPDLPIHSPARFFCPTAAGQTTAKKSPENSI